MAALLSALLWGRGQRRGRLHRNEDEDRLDTLLGWPPETIRVLSRSEMAAYSTLKRAFPQYMVLAQVPISRFISVPKKSSYGEWMRRLGGQCVDLAVCDLSSQVLAVVMVRPPEAEISDLLRRRMDRVPRSLKAAGVPFCVWNAAALPSIEAARVDIGSLLGSNTAADPATARTPADDCSADVTSSPGSVAAILPT